MTLSNLNKAKDVLERLEILAGSRQSSGMNVLNELQVLMDMAKDAVNDLYEYEAEIEQQYQQEHLVYELQEAIEKGDAA